MHMAWQTAFALFASLFPSPGVPLVSGACYWYHFPPPSSPLALGHMISSFHCCPAARMLCPAPLYSWGPWHGPGLFVLCKPILPVLPSRAICYTPAARRVIYTQPLGPPPSAPHPSPFTACRPHRPFPPGSASRCLTQPGRRLLVPALCDGMMIGVQDPSVVFYRFSAPPSRGQWHSARPTLPALPVPPHPTPNHSLPRPSTWPSSRTYRKVWSGYFSNTRFAVSIAILLKISLFSPEAIYSPKLSLCLSKGSSLEVFRPRGKPSTPGGGDGPYRRHLRRHICPPPRGLPVGPPQRPPVVRHPSACANTAHRSPLPSPLPPFSSISLSLYDMIPICAVPRLGPLCALCF